MRIFVAGASGVLGRALVPLLVEAGHAVGGMTRSPEKAALLASLGAEPFVCDVYDTGRLDEIVVDFGPECVVHQLTDLPDDVTQIAAHAAANARIRTVGTANLLAAATAAGTGRVLAQSISWTPTAGAASRDTLEAMILDAGGVVLRYGQLYGPGTYYESAPPPEPRVHIDDAARRTLANLDAPSGILVIDE